MTNSASTRWWCELAWLGGEDAQPGVVLECDERGVLSRVEPGVSKHDSGDATVLMGLTIPGLVNAHSHAFHRGLRGRTQTADGGSFWTWREKMYLLAERLQPDTYLTLAAAVFAEMAMSGITTVGEFHYLHHDHGGRPYADDAMGQSLIAAAADAGIRITLLDTCYLAGGISRSVEGVQLRFADGRTDSRAQIDARAAAEAWAGRVDRLTAAARNNDMVRIGAAIHSVRAVPPEAITTVATWATQAEVPLHAHVSEQPAENQACQAAYGLTPTGLLAERGALGPRFSAVHATHLSGPDFALLGGSGSSVCLCPTTERDLADGIGAAKLLRSNGVKLCLGSDSHAVIDLFEEARSVELDERLATGQRGHHSPADLLGDATVRGARALGWDQGGELRVGAPADFATLRLDSVGMAGTVAPGGQGAAAAAVFAGGARDVTDVVAAGRPIVTDGAHFRFGTKLGHHISAAVAAVIGREP